MMTHAISMDAMERAPRGLVHRSLAMNRPLRALAVSRPHQYAVGAVNEARYGTKHWLTIYRSQFDYGPSRR
jgi:hypothetical protein